MSILDQVRNKVDEAKKTGKLREKDGYHPQSSRCTWAVYCLVRDGFRPSKTRPRLVGATDTEIQIRVKGKASTVRWARWSLEKYGWIEKAGFKRQTRPGETEMDVYKITDRSLDSSVPLKAIDYDLDYPDIDEEITVIDVEFSEPKKGISGDS